MSTMPNSTQQNEESIVRFGVKAFSIMAPFVVLYSVIATTLMN